MDELEEYTGMFICETDMAILFVPDDFYDSNLDYEKEDAVWLPKSQIDYDKSISYERNDPITISIPNWLAEEKGL